MLFFVLYSVCAGAETIPVTVVRILDPVISEDGEVTADMTGLAVQVASGETVNGALAIVDLFVGDENEGSAGSSVWGWGNGDVPGRQ